MTIHYHAVGEYIEDDRDDMPELRVIAPGCIKDRSTLAQYRYAAEFARIVSECLNNHMNSRTVRARLEKAMGDA